MCFLNEQIDKMSTSFLFLTSLSQEQSKIFLTNVLKKSKTINQIKIILFLATWSYIWYLVFNV